MANKALLLSSFNEPPKIVQQPIPPATPGSVVVRILCTNIIDYTQDVFNGKRGYSLSFPLIPGIGGIGRVHATGPDSVNLSKGELVYVDGFIRARDYPDASFLHGWTDTGSTGGKQLMDGEWRNGTFANFVKAPLENIFPLQEEKLMRFGYGHNDLCYILRLLVPFGGLGAADVRAGDSVIVAPATGSFGGAAVECALALGANVLAIGRHQNKLDDMKRAMSKRGAERLQTLELSGEIGKDAEAAMAKSLGRKGFDTYIDFSPPAAAKSPHIQVCLMALKTGGKAVLMGGITSDIMIPYPLLMSKNLQVQGRFMYERSDTERLLSIVHSGLLPLGKRGGIETVAEYKLDSWKQALEDASNKSAWGKQVVFKMNDN